MRQYGNQMFPQGTDGAGYGAENPSNYGSGNLGGTNNNFNLGGAMLGSGIGGLASMLFGGGQSPMDAANQYMNQMPSAIGQYMDPYMNAGIGAMGNLQGQYGNLMSNPGGMLNQIGSSYHQSPGFQFALKQAMMGANQGAAAGGMAGSPMGQQQNMGIATQLGNQDYYNYLQKALGMYGKGLQGEQDLAGTGMQAGTNMSNVMANQLQEQAAMAYQNQAAQNQAQGSIFGDIGAGLGAFFGG